MRILMARLSGIGILILFMTGCYYSSQGILSVREGKQLIYQCETGERITAQYYTLSDDSLHFVKVTLPDGRQYTLPQVLSASGVRYTDDAELVWWTKGESAFAETRGLDGQWQILYRDCKAISPR